MSKLFLGIDTETTGFRKKGSLIQEGQARVCQLAMVLVNEDKKPLAKFSSLIKPDGWVISEGASKVNGLTNEMCEATGLSMKSVYELYLKWSAMADTKIAHNAAFDRGMMEVEAAYFHNDNGYRARIDGWHCTMQENAHLSGGKSLENCLQHHCGRSVGENAHDAMVDTEACLDVFFALRDKAAA